MQTASAAPPPSDRWLTIREAAAIAGFKLNTMYALCLKRTLPSYKVGAKMRRVKEADLITWMEHGRVEAQEEGKQ